MASEIDDAAGDDDSSCLSDDFADSSPPLQLPRRKREVAPPGSIKRAYLDFTFRIPRDQHLAGLTPCSIKFRRDLDNTARGNRSLETTPLFTRRFSAVLLDDLETDQATFEVQLESKSQHRGFHSLPSEVRVLIFKEVLRVEEVEQALPAVELRSKSFEGPGITADMVIQTQVYPSFVNLSQERPADKKYSVLNLLMVCRTFYHEAVPLFYQVNLLRLSSPAMLYGFLKDLPRLRRKHIHRLRIGGIGFHYSGWQLATKAISMLSLCENLQHLELELAWNQENANIEVDFSFWNAALEKREDYQPSNNEEEDDDQPSSQHDSHRTVAINEIQSATRCLQTLQGLKTIQLEMVGLWNPLLLNIGGGSASWDSLEKFKRTVSEWATRVTRSVTTDSVTKLVTWRGSNHYHR